MNMQETTSGNGVDEERANGIAGIGASSVFQTRAYRVRIESRGRGMGKKREGFFAGALGNGVLLWMAVGVAGSTHAAAADKSEDTKKICVARHEQAQILRRNSKLTEARAALLVCAQDSCPGGIRADCVEWLGAVSNAIPSVVIAAKMRDKDEYNVRVTVDDALVTSRLDGIALELNPGVHTFRLEVAGQDPIEQQLLLVEGQKSRILNVRFGRPEPESPAGGANTGRAPDTYRPVPTLDYILAGVGVLGIGSFAGFGLWGLDQKKSLEGTCSPVCTSTQTAPVRAKFMVADVSLGVAVLSTVVAAYVYFTRPAFERSTPASADIRGPLQQKTTVVVIPTRSGAVFGLQGAL
jgi:hypothetical protein